MTKQNDSLNMKVPKAALDAAAESARLVLEILAEHGVNIGRPDSKDQRAQFLKEIKDKKIEFRKILHADNPDSSGMQIWKNGVIIGFVQSVVVADLII